MLVVNTDYIPGKQIVDIKGLVQGNTVRAKHVGRDIMAGARPNRWLAHVLTVENRSVAGTQEVKYLE